jgi:streptogramin lyase
MSRSPRKAGRTGRTATSLVIAFATIGSVLLAMAAPASATIGQITDFQTPTSGSQPRAVTLGPDGNVWFTECNTGTSISAVGKITPGGTVTEYPTTTPNACPMGITTGPDGNLWFTERAANKVGVVTTSGVMTEYSTGTSSPEKIVTGPDGNLWFTNRGGNSVSKMSTSGTVLATYPLGAGTNPFGIASGPDGRIWVAETGIGSGVGAIAAVNTSGGVATYQLPCAICSPSPQEITVGPDGNLWFTESGNNGAPPAIGSISVVGDVTEVLVPNGATPWGITTGPDGNIWFTDNGNFDFVGRYNINSGNFTDFLVPNQNNAVEDITTGGDGNLWVAEGAGSQQIARVRLSWNLSVTVTGTGFGSVSSSPSGINCPATSCSAFFTEGSSVTLTESPAVGSSFAGWSGGGCSGTGLTCSVTMSQAQSVTATFNAYRPDLQIALGAKPAIGDNIYNSNAAGQTIKVKVSPGKSAVFEILVQNDAATSDSFRLKGPGKTKGFTVTYMNGSNNITSAVTAGTYGTGSIASGSSVTITLKVVVAKTAKAGSVWNGLVTGTSQNDPSKFDAVKAVVTAS